MVNLFRFIFAQSEEDKARYERLGADPARVVAAGNLKYDALPDKVLPEEAGRLRFSAGIEENRPVWIAGSTHKGEYELLLEVHCALRSRFPDLLLVLAPRQPHDVSIIIAMCDHYRFAVSRRSLGESAMCTAVYMLDTMGELGTFYAVANAAFIGGSLIPFGGHNPLEAVVQGKPVLWGPHMSNFREIEEGLLATGCGEVVNSAAEMQEALALWLANPSKQADYGRHAEAFLQSRRGVSHSILNCLLKDLAKHQR
jgi:3-deoxy-D-manno-octulosonic-acid transferase